MGDVSIVRMHLVKKIILGVLVLLAMALAAMVAFSPYKKHEGMEGRSIRCKVEINAPVEVVFAYLGNSDNARTWSVFVDHIVPLNADSIADGLPGSRRRAYCTEDEQGRRWDELITIVEPNQRRQLVVYDFVDFPVTAEGLATEQLYKVLSPEKTEVTFTVFYKDHEPTWMERLKTHFASYTIESIFEQNLDNIRKDIEGGAR